MFTLSPSTTALGECTPLVPCVYPAPLGCFPSFSIQFLPGTHLQKEVWEETALPHRNSHYLWACWKIIKMPGEALGREILPGLSWWGQQWGFNPFFPFEIWPHEYSRSEQTAIHKPWSEAEVSKPYWGCKNKLTSTYGGSLKLQQTFANVRNFGMQEPPLNSNTQCTRLKLFRGINVCKIRPLRCLCVVTVTLGLICYCINIYKEHI